MTLQQITAGDIADWDSLDDIADTFEKRGLKRQPDLGGDDELVLQLTDTEFITLVEAGPGESPSEFKPDNRRQRTNLVATDDYAEFTFLTRVRSWEGQQHGRIKHQKLSFTKEQMTSDEGAKNTVLQKLNDIEYGSAAAIRESLYDTQRVVKEFYEEFEALRTDLVQEVSGIPDDRGDAKQRYVQIVLDRMIFLYFIQEKRLLDRDTGYLRDMHDEYAEQGDDVYDEFYYPLFFDILAEGKSDPEFGNLPYLNGGLFSKNPVEEEFEDARLGATTEETNGLFDDILDFLSDWNWNVDERLDIVDPKNLSPAVLGHIFEQTVNQKEMGAYYTPEEITGFMARRTIHPYLLDQLNEAVDAEYEEIDDVFGFDETDAGADGAAAVADGGTVTAQVAGDSVTTDHVETLYHDVLTEARVLDPAVGSGAFLLAAQEVLLDIYMQCLEYFQRLEAEGQAWDLGGETRDLLEEIEANRGNTSLYAKRSIILNNLYGVDIDDGAVEICKLRLWLSMVADIEDEPSEVDTLPNIDFNIRQGNSLIGRVDHIEPGTDDDVDPAETEDSTWSDWQARDWQEEISEAIQEYKQAESSEAVTEARQQAENLIDSYRPDFDENLLRWCQEHNLDDLTLSELEDFDPFHWTLEFAAVYDGGGFDVVIGNPPWDRLKPLRDDYFSKYDEAFRMRKPADKDAKQSELLDDPKIRNGWENYKTQMKRRAEIFNKYPGYEKQTASVGGRTHGTENDLSALFFERVFSLAKDGGHVSQILPGSIFTGSSTKQLRGKLIDDTQVNSIVTFENKGIFPDIDNRYNFGIVTFQNGGETETLKASFQQRNLSILLEFDERSLNIPVRVLKEYSPEARTFPMINSEGQTEALDTIVQHERISKPVNDSWYAKPYAELHRTNDTDRFSESKIKNGYPVLGGRNVYQYEYDPTHFDDLTAPEFWSVPEEEDPKRSAKRRIREKNRRKLKSALAEQLDGRKSSESMKAFVNRRLEEERGHGLSDEDVRLDCNEYRIVYRDVARAADERTMIATVIPPGWVCHNTLHTIRPYEINVDDGDLSDSPLDSIYDRIFTNRELFVTVGLLNSIPFDFLMRTKVDTHMVMYKFEESQVPHLTVDDDWFDEIADRAAQLNCYGDAFSDMREHLGGIDVATDPEERKQLRAEIDAAAFHAYGFDRETVEFVLRDFDKVNDPRVMTKRQFQRVADAFQEFQ